MADTTYNVRVKYNVDRASAEADANALARTFDRLAAAAAGAFAVHRVVDFMKKLTNLQSQNEQLQISFAAMLTGYGAAGFTNGGKDFQKAMEASAGLMEKIRVDAAKLPGTAEELAEIMRAAMPGGIHAGKSILGPDSVEEMAKRLLVVSNRIPGGAATVAREFQAIMEGRAIGRNDLFAHLRSTLGMSPKELNALSEPQKWEAMMKALKVLVDPALPAHAQAFKAVATTTLTWAQQFARVVDKGVHEQLIKYLREINDWYEKNRTAVEAWGAEIGKSLGDAAGNIFSTMKDALAFIVANRETIMSVLKMAALVAVGGKFLGGGGAPAGSLQGIGSGALGGLLLNQMSGGNIVTGTIMTLMGALTSFGGSLGIAAAAVVAFGVAANAAADAVDKAHKKQIEQAADVDSLSRAYDTFKRSGGGDPAVFGVVRSIIRDKGLMGYMGSIKGPEFDSLMQSLGIDPTRGTYGSGHKTRAQEIFDMFSDVAYRMHEVVPFGPGAPTAEQKLQQLLYQQNKPVPEKRDVNVTVNIKQDISQAEDPDRILVRTKQAIEDALIRPVESGHNRFSVLR